MTNISSQIQTVRGIQRRLSGRMTAEQSRSLHDAIATLEKLQMLRERLLRSAGVGDEITANAGIQEALGDDLISVLCLEEIVPGKILK